MKRPFTLLVLALAQLAFGDVAARADSLHAASLESWRAARFGMFIHWGPVSVQGTEIGWSRAGERRGYWGPGTEVPVEVYDHLYEKFNPDQFDARAWVAIAQAAGMKYLVFTSRHHDGFSMFDTQASDYKITSARSPFRRDVVRELADACHAAGLKFGLYYSQPDWHSPDAFTPQGHSRYLEFLKTQLRELLSNYGRIDILWFDGLDRSAEAYDAPALNQLARELQPGILINNRNGLPEDFDTPEQRVGKYQDDRPWESCITICNQWSWKPGDPMKSLKECLQTLVLAAGGDGNLLFNVGPMPDGRIEPGQVERLKQMGAWLAKNGASIYGTRGGPWKPTKALASTRRDNLVFVHVLRSTGGRIELPDIPRTVHSASLVGGGTARVTQHAGKLVLEWDDANSSPIDTVVKLQIEGSASDLPAISLPAEITATCSNQSEPISPAALAFDRDPGTSWVGEPGTTSGWIAWMETRPLTVERIRVDEGKSDLVRRFEFQYRAADGAWITVFAGTKIGRWFQQEFTPVTAREFRVVLLETTATPSLAEIELFEQ